MKKVNLFYQCHFIVVSDISRNNIYLKWYNEFIKDYPVTGYIYIKTSPDKAFERVLKFPIGLARC